MSGPLVVLSVLRHAIGESYANERSGYDKILARQIRLGRIKMFAGKPWLTMKGLDALFALELKEIGAQAFKTEAARKKALAEARHTWETKRRPRLLSKVVGGAANFTMQN